MLKFLSSPIISYYEKLISKVVILAEEESTTSKISRVLVKLNSDTESIVFKAISSDKELFVSYDGTHITVTAFEGALISNLPYDKEIDFDEVALYIVKFFSTVDRISDCDYMLENTDDFIKYVFEDEPDWIKAYVGMVSAHGDKSEQYRDDWEEQGLSFRKAQIIYFLTFTKLMDRPKSESKEWVIENYAKYEGLLP